MMKNDNLLEQAKELFDFCSPSEIRQDLNLLFTDYISRNKESLPDDIDKISSRIYFLNRFLERIES